MDTRKLDQLEQFSAFIEFLTKPEDYKTLVQELNKAAQSFRTEAENIRQTQDFQLWRNEETATLEENKKQLASDTEALAQLIKQNQQSHGAQLQELAIMRDEIDSVKKEWEAKTKAVADVKPLKETLHKDRDQLNQEQTAFQTRVKEFDKKAAAFAAMMKGMAL